MEKLDWEKLEARIKTTIESAGICYPLFAELKRLSGDAPGMIPYTYACHYIILIDVQSEKSPDAKISLDPWNICRAQFIHVPQFVLDVVNDQEIEDKCI